MRRVRFKEPAGHVREGEWTDDGIEFGGRTYDPEAVDVLPLVELTKVICVAANYVEHVRESDRDVPEDLSDRPSVFMKGPNAVVGYGDTITLPTPGVTADDADDAGDIEIGSSRIDYEAELSVVIGEQCRNIPKDDAEDVVKGCTPASTTSRTVTISITSKTGSAGRRSTGPLRWDRCSPRRTRSQTTRASACT